MILLFKIQLILNIRRYNKQKQQMKKTKRDYAHFIVNDKRMTFISNSLQKLSKFSDEESKDEHIPTIDERNSKTHKGIDIKKDTDRLTNHKIIQLINEELYGSNSLVVQQTELNQMLSDLNICKATWEPFMKEIPILFEDSAETILKREGRASVLCRDEIRIQLQ